MSKPELGTKRVCVSCGARFYDLTRVPATCPKCGTEQPADIPRPRRAGGNVADDKRLKKPPAAAEETDGDAEVATEGEEDVLEDAGELEDDADTLDADLEVEPEGEDPEQ